MVLRIGVWFYRGVSAACLPEMRRQPPIVQPQPVAKSNIMYNYDDDDYDNHMYIIIISSSSSSIVVITSITIITLIITDPTGCEGESPTRR